ncbi:nuclear transport factor 2 family protein [Lacisediminihabitans profunda]|uniref:Nuclear transport factor 2 family protein n=1 Tax=Lacisediminihabitans profunda TaxID=2594790 RepID=A0A5C8UKT0_9MICO|nr:nuclear transport factor 2 family protein [Lacisediminihabitans profunda]TXN28898.1 nuclear transport factor 2 family protein [Lacisediminihabitans profunda]
MTDQREQQAIKAIRAANTAVNTAMVEARIDKLKQLLADDFVLAHITGYEQPKAEWLEEIRTGQMAYHDIRERSVDVQVDGSRALLVARNHVNATIWGSKALWPLRMTTTLAEIDGVWKPTHSRATTF